MLATVAFMAVRPVPQFKAMLGVELSDPRLISDGRAVDGAEVVHYMYHFLGAGMAEDVLGVHDFRAAVSDLLERFRADPTAEPVVVGAYRRREAVLLPAAQFDELVRRRRLSEDHPDLPAIRAQLARSPEQRLAGLAAGAAFFAAARSVR